MLTFGAIMAHKISDYMSGSPHTIGASQPVKSASELMHEIFGESGRHAAE